MFNIFLIIFTITVYYLLFTIISLFAPTLKLVVFQYKNIFLQIENLNNISIE